MEFYIKENKNVPIEWQHRRLLVDADHYLKRAKSSLLDVCLLDPSGDDITKKIALIKIADAISDIEIRLSNVSKEDENK